MMYSKVYGKIDEKVENFNKELKSIKKNKMGIIELKEIKLRTHQMDLTVHMTVQNI